MRCLWEMFVTAVCFLSLLKRDYLSKRIYLGDSLSYLDNFLLYMEWYLSTSLIAPPFNMKLAWTFSYLELKYLSGNTKLLPRFLQAQNSTRTLLQPKIHVSWRRGETLV